MTLRCLLGFHHYVRDTTGRRARREATYRHGRPAWYVWNVRCARCGRTGYIGGGGAK